MEAKDEASEAGEGLRKHRRLLRDRPPVPSSDYSTGGRIEGYLPRPYPARDTRLFEQDLLGVLLFFSMAFNVLDAEPLRIFFSQVDAGPKGAAHEAANVGHGAAASPCCPPRCRQCGLL